MKAFFKFIGLSLIGLCVLSPILGWLLAFFVWFIDGVGYGIVGLFTRAPAGGRVTSVLAWMVVGLLCGASFFVFRGLKAQGRTSWGALALLGGPGILALTFLAGYLLR